MNKLTFYLFENFFVISLMSPATMALLDHQAMTLHPTCTKLRQITTRPRLQKLFDGTQKYLLIRVGAEGAQMLQLELSSLICLDCSVS